MRCQQIQELLSAYLDGEVEPSQQSQIKVHLETCPACRGQWEDLVASVALLRGLPEVSPPAFFREQLRLKLESRSFSAPRRRSWFGWPRFIAAAAVLMVALSVTTLWSGYIHPQDFLPWKNDRDSAQSITVAGRSPEKEGSIVSPGLRQESLKLEARASREKDGRGDGDVGRQEVNAGGNSLLREDTGKEAPSVTPPRAAPRLMAFSSPEMPSGEGDKSVPGTSRSGSNGELRVMAGSQNALPAPEGKMVQASDADLPGTDVKTVKEFILILEVPDISKARKDVLHLVQKYNGLTGPEEPEVVGQSSVQSTVMIIIPDEFWSKFQEDLKSLGQVKEPQTRSRDITLEYNGLVKNLALLKEKEKELQSSTTGSDLQELQRVQGEINKTMGQLHALSEAARKTAVELVLCTNSSCQQDQLQVK